MKLVQRTDNYGTDFIVNGNTAALSAPSERTFDNDLVTILDGHTADDFQGTCVVFQQKLKRRLPLLVRDGLKAADLSHHDDLFAVIMLRMRDDLG